MNILLSIILVCNCQFTSYRSVKEQTDDSPFITATGEFVHSSGVAISRDLHIKYGGTIRYGDILLIEDYGFRVVNDLMAVRHKNSVDIWVKTYEEEKAVGVQNKKVWLIKETK